jgi:purine catabolism regulator
MKETADRLDFPIITCPDDYLFREICDFMNNNFYSPLTQEIKRQDEVIKEINEAILKDGLSGVLRTLHKWSGRNAALLMGKKVTSYPEEGNITSMLVNPSAWSLKVCGKEIYKNVLTYEHTTVDLSVEWLGARIPNSSHERDFLLLFKDDMEFTREDYVLLTAALSACAIEIKRIQHISDVERKHRRELFSDMLNQKLTYDEAKYMANTMGYEISSQGSVVLIEAKSEILGIDLDHFLGESNEKGYSGIVPIWVHLDSHIIVLYVPDISDNQLMKLYRQLHARSEQYKMSIGVGRIRKFQDMYKSFTDAKRAIGIGSCLNLPCRIFNYSEMGFYRFIDVERNQEEIQDYYHDYIKPIRDQFSGEHYEEIIQTLMQFVESRFSFVKTAERMHLHRNTISYRMSVIEKLCGVDVQDHEDCLNLSLACKLYPLMKIK